MRKGRRLFQSLFPSLSAVLLAAQAASGATDCRALRLSTCPRPADARLPAARDMLRWQGEDRVVGLRNTWRLYPADVFRTAGATPAPLPPAEHPIRDLHYRFAGQERDLAGYLARQRVAGLLLLKDGRIALEYYGLGNTDTTLWTSRSVAKSVVSILIGIAIREGRIHSIDDPIVRYFPELARTAWREVSLRQLITHTSGIAWNENYADPHSDFAALTRCEAQPDPYPCVMRLVASRPRRPGIAPGELWSYNTGGAWLVGRVLEQATGMPVARYLESRIWQAVPMEHDGVWQALIPGRIDMGGHGFNATLRDWGRFGLFVERGGRLPDGTALLPDDWIRTSTTWTRARGSVTPATPEGQYGFQWWFNPGEAEPGDPQGVLAVARESFWALGIYGQAIAIDPLEHVVMVQWSAWPAADPGAAMEQEMPSFFAAAVHALRAPQAAAEIPGAPH